MDLIREGCHKHGHGHNYCHHWCGLLGSPVGCLGPLHPPSGRCPGSVVKQYEVLGMDTMGNSLQVFLYPPVFCISGLAFTINLHLGQWQSVWKMLFKGGPLVWCLKGSHGGTGRGDSWLWLGQIWETDQLFCLHCGEVTISWCHCDGHWSTPVSRNSFSAVGGMC